MISLPTLEPVVPAAPPAAGDNVLYEIVNGRYVELPPMSTAAGMIASRLGHKLAAHAEAQELGEVANEILFGLDPDGRLRRRPDLAFVSYRRWPRGQPWPHTDPWLVVPDLAVEVVSPTDPAEALMQKVAEYLRAGVAQVWVVYPVVQFVLVYESLTQVRGLTAADELDGGAALPGFRLSLATLFAGVVAG